MYYRLTLVVDSNTFKTSDPLQYELVSTNTSANGEVIPSVSKTNITSSSINLGDGYFIKASNATHVYQLKIYYPRTDENQNDNQNASFNSHVEIKSVTKPKELGFDTIQRGAIKNKVFSTKEPGTLKFQFLCESKEQKSGGIIPMAFCLDYELSISNYVINENSTNESDKYIIEMSEYYDYNRPNFNKPGGDTEIVDINITQGIIDNYKGRIPFDFDVRAPLHSDISLPQLGQAYWFRLYFIDSSDNLYLVDWLHMDKDGTPPSDDGTGGIDGTEIEETEESALAACLYSDCKI
ncbi:MAG: hypothetical protein Q4C33_04730 [bacterium]|nr:hypothetical protein [bacterium]